MRIKITNGLDIPLAGLPEPAIEAGRLVRSVAVLGADYVGLKPKMLVQEGDQVTLGQALFVDKRDPAVLFTAPGSGTVSEINRGARRVLLSVVINLDDSETDIPTYANLANTDPAVTTSEDIRSALLTSGLWTAFRTRPYSKIPLSDSQPHSIFVTAIDTQPLSADPQMVVASHQEAFLHGLQIIAQLTKGPVYLCTGIEWKAPVNGHAQLRHVEFTGPHPTGLPGTHIHFLDPVSADKTVWHIGYQDVIAIGKLFSKGRLWIERTVALGGEGFESPRVVKTRQGANINELVASELQHTKREARSPRLISGSVLNGRKVEGVQSYLGRYHVQISAIPDEGQRKLFGWLSFFSRCYSFAGLFKRQQGHAKLLSFSTVQNGRRAALIPVDAFERVMPLDILPIPMLRALLIKDTDQAQALGCLELDADDLALCSFVCPGKKDYGAILRINLDQIERNG